MDFYDHEHLCVGTVCIAPMKRTPKSLVGRIPPAYAPHPTPPHHTTPPQRSVEITHNPLHHSQRAAPSPPSFAVRCQHTFLPSGDAGASGTRRGRLLAELANDGRTTRRDDRTVCVGGAYYDGAVLPAFWDLGGSWEVGEGCLTTGSPSSTGLVSCSLLAEDGWLGRCADA